MEKKYIVRELNLMIIKKKEIAKYILLLFSTILSIVIFIFIYESISYIKYQNSNISTIDKISKQNDLEKPLKHIENKDRLSIHRAYIECMENSIMEDCTHLNNSNTIKPISKSIKAKVKTNKMGYELFKDLKHSNIIIKFIYLLQILTLVQQIYLFLLSRFKHVLDSFDFHKSEWAINVAPMFGLLGTFFSIAILLNSNNENIDTTLIKNFFDAVMTTMIGIIFYIINFYLKIFIYPIIIESRND